MTTKRSLILSGGGVKAAFQAGVLQVWLDEAGVEFDHGDGTSSGAFNLAMWCQGMTGKEIADAWRRTKPADGVSLDAGQFARLLWARSLFTFDGLRRNVFPAWGLDWPRINASGRDATFNAFNFSKQELAVFSARQMDEDRLCACASLPMWFPPVEIDGDLHIDAVPVVNANVEEAIARGADQIWCIWMMSTRGAWDDGFVANYFQMIEASANGQLARTRARIEANNAAVAAGGRGEFGRRIHLRILQAEVPIHYLINFSQDRVVECVNLGVNAARRWCEERAIPLRRGDEAPTSVHTARTRLHFTEQMKGFVTRGDTDCQAGYAAGKAARTAATFEVTIRIDGVNRFIADPAHEAPAEGWFECAAFGGRRPISDGSFNLLVDAGDPHQKAMYYRLWFEDDAGRPLTLLGHKDIKDDPGFDVWSDTTTLYTRILEGHVTREDEGGAPVRAAGILKIYFVDFLKQLTTFRAEGPTFADRSAALVRFGELFLGKLWDVYASHVLSYGPF